MRKLYILFTLFICPFTVLAQNWCFTNPSLEGPQLPHVVPAPWQGCYGSPDTQPGNWGITQAPTDGNSYVSFLHSGGVVQIGYNEGMSQQLPTPLTGGQTYKLTVDLAHSLVYSTAGPGTCYSSLIMYGGNSTCAQTEILWQSGPFFHTNWQQYTITFTPSANWTWVSFSPYNTGTNCSGYINVMMDNLSCITILGMQTTDVTCYGLCDGSATVFVPTLTTTPPYTYLWSTGDTTQTINNLCPGTYYVTVTDSNNQVIMDTAVITQPAPLNTTIDSASTAICFNATNGFLSASVTGGTSPYTYSWSNGGNTSTITNLSPGTYTLTITDDNGCTDTITDTVISYPQVPFSFVGDTLLCEEENLQIIVSGVNQYFWAGPSNFNSTNDTIVIINVQQSNAGNYFIQSTDSNGCQRLDTIHVSILPSPNVSAAANSPICEGAQIHLNGTGAGNISWIGPNNFTSGQQDTSFIATLSSEGTYTASITNSIGCTGSDTVFIDVTPKPIADLGPDTGICDQAIYLVPLNLYNGATYNWSTGETTDSILVDTAGFFSVSITTNCGTDSDTIKVSLYGGPVAMMEDTVIGCNQDSIILDAQNPGSIYFWQNTGDSTQLLEVSQQGTYTVEITRCQQTVIDSAFVQKLTEVSLELPNIFSPNGDGVNDEYFLIGSPIGITDFRAQIFNRWGNSLFKSDEADFKWNGQTGTNIAVNAGVYYIVVEYQHECSEGKTTEKIGTIQIVK